MRLVEEELYSNEDSTMSPVRAFEENAVHKGHRSLVKEATTFAEELGITLNPLSPSIKLQILFLCFHTFLTEVVERSC